MTGTGPPADLRMEVLGDGDAAAFVPTGVGELSLMISGRLGSHSPEVGCRRAGLTGTAERVRRFCQVPRSARPSGGGRPARPRGTP